MDFKKESVIDRIKIFTNDETIGLIAGIVENLSEAVDAFQWNGSSEVGSCENVLICTDGQGRDQKIVFIVKDDGNYSEDMLLLAAQFIKGHEEFDWVDLDAVEWSIVVGNSFHGIPAPLHHSPILTQFESFGLMVNNEELPEEHYYYCIIQCTDWAS
jgi:hypothetical protein